MADNVNTGSRQLELNRKLERLLYAKHIDPEQIEQVLKEGADPMGSANEDDPDEHIFGEILCQATDVEDYPELLDKLPEITQRFIDCGMRIKNDPNHPFDGNNCNPLWDMFFCVSRQAIAALRILLDNGLKADVFDDFVDHVFIDLGHCFGDIGIEQAESDVIELLDNAFKMVFLGASYPHIIRNSEYLRECISFMSNDYDLTKFRDWDAFKYTYDFTKASAPAFGFADTKVGILEKATGNLVWEFTI